MLILQKNLLNKLQFHQNRNYNNDLSQAMQFPLNTHQKNKLTN